MDDMNEIKRDLVSLDKEVSGIKVMLNEVHGAIIGNTLSKDGGIVKRLETAEEKLDNVHDKISRLEKINVKLQIYQKVLWGCAGGVATAVFAYILQLWFNK